MTMNDNAPVELHSDVGPSAWERLIQCPGSNRVARGLTPVDSTHSLEGTAAHTVSEWCREKDCAAADFLGTMVPVQKVDGSFVHYECNQTMVDAVQSFLDYVNDFPCDVVLNEGKIDYSEWVENGWGTLDDARVAEGVCRVTDLKYGEGVKKWAEGNPQLMLYALGVYQEFNFLYDIEKFILVIHQPRLEHIDEWEITTEDLLDWANNFVRPHGELIASDNAPVVAGKDCQFCVAREGKNAEGTACKVRAESLLEHTMEGFVDLNALHDAELKQLETLTDDEINAIGPRLDDLKSFISGFLEMGKQRLLERKPFGSARLVVGGGGGRKWKDEKRAKSALKRAGLRAAEYMITQPKKFITAPQAEKLLDKDVAVQIMDLNAKDPLVIKPDGQPAVAFGPDKRKDYVFPVEADGFAPVEEEDEDDDF